MSQSIWIEMRSMGIRGTNGAATIAVVVALVAALVSGCGAMSSIKNGGVANPLTPEQSKAQVVDAAQGIVGALKLQVIEPAFWHASCNDQGEAPFRGQMTIGYPQATSFEASDAEVAQMVQHLQSIGWTGDPDFQSHGTVLKKDNVVAVFVPQNASDSTRSIELYGECRDVTTTKDTRGNAETVTLPSS
jgi:hypothetical protein